MKNRETKPVCHRHCVSGAMNGKETADQGKGHLCIIKHFRKKARIISWRNEVIKEKSDANQTFSHAMNSEEMAILHDSFSVGSSAHFRFFCEQYVSAAIFLLDCCHLCCPWFWAERRVFN